MYFSKKMRIGGEKKGKTNGVMLISLSNLNVTTKMVKSEDYVR